MQGEKRTYTKHKMPPTSNRAEYMKEYRKIQKRTICKICKNDELPKYKFANRSVFLRHLVVQHRVLIGDLHWKIFLQQRDKELLAR